MTDERLLVILRFLAGNPGCSPGYVALVVRQDVDAVRARLELAAEDGLVVEQHRCCGQEPRYAVTPKGALL